MIAKNPLILVCAVAFLAGGAAAVVFTRPAAEPVGVHAPAVRGDGAGQAATAETVKGDSEDAHVGEAAVSEGSEPAPESGAVGAESSRAGVEGVEVAKSSREAKSRAAAVRADEGSRDARGYARVSAGRQASGGSGIAGHTVGGVKKAGQGVKKTGAAIGKTFGKIGGVFHD